MLTKGGSSVEEMGVDFRGRKGEVDQMAPLSISTHSRSSGNTGPGQGGDSQHGYPAGRGKESSIVLVTQSTFIGSADPTNIFEHFLLVGSLIYLLTFPG